MIHMDWGLIIPPLLTALVTYLIAAKRAKIKHSQVMAEIQANAIKVVAEIEERLRAELKKDLVELRRENEELRVQVSELKGMLNVSDHLVDTLKEEISALRSTIELYKDEMARNKKRLVDLENGTGSGE